MRTSTIALLALLAAPPAAGQEADHVYTNPVLGVRFPGVFGWEVEKFGESGAWNTLSRYSESAFEASVELQVSPNNFSTADELRRAIRKEFAEPKYQVTEESEVQLKGGARLKGIRILATRQLVDEEGKKRERRLLVDTYMGKTRLFRVRCSARRFVYRRIADRFVSAINGLRIEPGKEQVAAAVQFRSQRGAYACRVPEGFSVTLPPARSNADIRFESRTMSLSVFTYRFDGDLLDHIEQLVSYYGNVFTVEQEETQVLGGPGFVGRISSKKGEEVILGTGNRGGRVLRIHHKFPKKSEEEARRIREAFLKSVKIG
ncbi:MAG: hypothetical protein ACE5JG_13485 [Planctomycetota bacterium]